MKKLDITDAEHRTRMMQLDITDAEHRTWMKRLDITDAEHRTRMMRLDITDAEHRTLIQKRRTLIQKRRALILSHTRKDRMEKQNQSVDKQLCRRETKHSMRRRCSGWDYSGRGIYMITLGVEGRRPLLGRLEGGEDDAWIKLTDLGIAVAQEIESISNYYPQIRVLCKQVMPDHVHFVLYVQEKLPVHIGKVIWGFKTGTKRVLCAGALGVPEESSKLWEDGNNDRKLWEDGNNDHKLWEEGNNDRKLWEEGNNDRKLWEEGYNDRILFHKGQLDAMIQYIYDNPRRLAIKRANPELFKIRQNIQIAGMPCMILGNRFLADYPIRSVIQCSRDLRQAEIDEKKAACMAEAANGTIHISGAISEGEKQICRALRKAGYPLIILLVEGFPPADSPIAKYYKPQGVYFEACAAGNLLLVQPDKQILERPDIVERVIPQVGRLVPHDSKRYRFVAMNIVAHDMSSDGTLTNIH